MTATNPLPPNVLRYGAAEPPPEQIPLRAGPLRLVFDNGDLRYVRLGDREVLRRVYVAVRDQNWDTIPARLSNLEVRRAEDTFRITFDARHTQGDVDFAWRGTLSGDADGTLRCAMDGEVLHRFLRNRIGWCILHPGDLGGARYRVEHSDGRTAEGVLPPLVSPHQPVMDMRAITHEVSPGVRAEVRFEGDIFEMEDQRNWTDDSFKTYSTPLALPYPVAVQQGERIAQTVTLSILGAAPAATEAGGPVSISVGGAGGRLPRIGLGVAGHGGALSAVEIERLRALRPAHLRVDLDLAGDTWRAALQRASDEARALGARLEVAAFVSDNAEDELTALRTAAHEAQAPLARWLVFHAGEKSSTTDRWVQLAREALEGYDPLAPIGGGSNYFFTELNRGRPPAGVLDVVAYSLNPTVHAADNSSLVETPAAQRFTVESARAFMGDTPIAVTPVTLRMRANPNATGPEAPVGPGELPPQVDPRQMSLLGAGFTLASLKYLALAGAASVTYFETTGWRGVTETQQGSPIPERFRSIPGGVYPLYHVLAAVGEFAGGDVLRTESSDRLRADALALRQDGRTRVLLANLTDAPQTVRLAGLGARARLAVLDEATAEAAMRAPEAFRAAPGEARETPGGRLALELRPYAVAFVDAAGEA